jgi:hypothetical protein
LGSKEDLWQARNAARFQRGTAAHRYSSYWSQTRLFYAQVSAPSSTAGLFGYAIEKTVAFIKHNPHFQHGA